MKSKKLIILTIVALVALGFTIALKIPLIVTLIIGVLIGWLMDEIIHRDETKSN